MTKKIFNTLILMAFFAFLPAVNPAVAAEGDSIPEKMQGGWSLISCDNPEESTVFTKHYVLNLIPDRVGLKPVWLKAHGADYDVFTADNDVSFAMHLSNADTLTVGALKPGIEPDLKTGWDALETDQKTEFIRCGGVAVDPSRKTVVETTAVIDLVQDACSAKLDETCKQALFAVADSNGNGRLSPSEIYFALKKLGILAGFAEQPQKSNETLAAEIETTDQRAKQIPRQVIFNFDSDKTQDVSYQELYGLDIGLTENASTLYFADVLKKAARLFPALAEINFSFRAKE